MAIRYVAYSQDGRRVEGSLPVDTPAQAEEMLWRSELTVVSLKEDRPALQQFRHQLYHQVPTLFKPKALELVSFTRELATLLHAGIPLYSALGIVQERSGNPLLREAIHDIVQRIQGGGSFSDAVARHPTIFPPLYARLATVGEETGRLELILLEIANYMEGQAILTRKVVSAIRYPAFVAVVAVGAGFILVTFSLPALTLLFKEYGANLPITTKILIAITDIASAYGKLMFASVILLTIGLWAYFRTARGAPTRDALVLKLPVFGRVARLAVLYRFTSGLHTMLNAGLPLVEALQLAERTSGNSQVQGALVKTREDIMSGRSLSQAVGRQPLFPRFFSQMIAVGEQSGTLSQNLDSLAKFFNQETDRAVTALTGMIEPAMILVIGGTVGFIAVAVMSSLYGIIGQIK
ncbi:MAG: type II secretion system F family protein [Chloroflexi bacterium]|nr:type II secretion system F family protein [Chloroflexota bacterium]